MNHQEFFINKTIPKPKVSKPKVSKPKVSKPKVSKPQKDMTDVVKNTAKPRVYRGGGGGGGGGRGGGGGGRGGGTTGAPNITQYFIGGYANGSGMSMGMPPMNMTTSMPMNMTTSMPTSIPVPLPSVVGQTSIPVPPPLPLATGHRLGSGRSAFNNISQSNPYNPQLNPVNLGRSQPNPLAAQAHDNIRRVDLQEIIDQLKKNSDDTRSMRDNLQKQSLNPNEVQRIANDIKQLNTQQTQMLTNVKEYHSALTSQVNSQFQMLGALATNKNRGITTEIEKLNTTADITKELVMAHAISSLSVGKGNTRGRQQSEQQLFEVINKHSTTLSGISKYGTIRPETPPLASIPDRDALIDRARLTLLSPRPEIPPPLGFSPPLPLRLFSRTTSPIQSVPAIQFSNRPDRMRIAAEGMISPRLQGEEYSEGAITVNNDDIPTDGEYEDDDDEAGAP